MLRPCSLAFATTSEAVIDVGSERTKAVLLCGFWAVVFFARGMGAATRTVPETSHGKIAQPPSRVPDVEQGDVPYNSGRTCLPRAPGPIGRTFAVLGARDTWCIVRG